MSRTKSFTERVAFHESLRYEGSSFGSYFSGVAIDDWQPATCVVDLQYGDNIPNWRSAIRDGQNATTSLSGTFTRILSQKEGFVEARFQSHLPGTTTVNWSHYYGGGFLGPFSFTIPDPLPTSTAKAVNRALARWNAKAAGVNRQFQGGVFFAELHKTLHGIAHPAEALFKGIESYSNAATKLRRSFVKDRAAFNRLKPKVRKVVSRSFSQAASGLWLEQSFHWLPLYYDIQGAINALAASWDSWPYHFIKVSATDEQSHTTTFGAQGQGIIAWTTKVEKKSGVTVKLYGNVWVRPRYPGRPDAAALGFDLASFVPTIWELIPYSWAVDYFTNIGDIIYGFSQGGTDVFWTSQGMKRYVRAVFSSSADTNHHNVPTSGWVLDHDWVAGRPSEVVMEKAAINRVPQISTYIPSLDYKVPGLSLKWLNLGAAFLQRSLAFL